MGMGDGGGRMGGREKCKSLLANCRKTGILNRTTSRDTYTMKNSIF